MGSIIISILTTILPSLSGAFKQYNERKMAEHEVIKARLAAQKDMALAKEKAQLELGTEQIKSTMPWFKHFTFFMWFGPFIITTVAPEWGARIFENWRTMPEWYAQSCVAVMFFIWGVQVGQDYIKGIFSNAAIFFTNRSKIKLRRKLFYDTLRSTKGNLTEYEVQLYEKALNEALGDGQKQEKDPD